MKHVVVVALFAAVLATGAVEAGPSQPPTPAPSLFHSHGTHHHPDAAVTISDLTASPARTGAGPASRTVVHGPNGKRLPRSRFNAELPQFVQKDIDGTVAGEPMVALTRDGTAFYGAMGPAVDVTVPRTFVMKSTDDGEGWADVSPFDPTSETTYATFDPFLHADPVTGRVFSVDLLGTQNCNNVAFTDDEGASWTQNKICPASDHQSLFTGPPTVVKSDGYPNLTYLYTNACDALSCFRRSLDGGETWSDPVTVFQTCGPQAGHGHASWSDGTLYIPRTTCDVPMSEDEQMLNQAEVAISRDNGQTWEIVVVDREFGVDKFHWGTTGSGQFGLRDQHEARVATDRAGNAYYVFTDERGIPRLSISRDRGRTWSRPVRVAPPEVQLTNSNFIDVVAGDTGKIAITYLGSPGWWAPRDRPEIYYPTWNQYVTVSVDALAKTPVFATTTTNRVEEPLKRGQCEFRCAGTNKMYGMMDFFNMTIHPRTGMVWTSLVDLCTTGCDGDTRLNTGLQPVPELELNQAGVGVQVEGPSLGSFLDERQR